MATKKKATKTKAKSKPRAAKPKAASPSDMVAFIAQGRPVEAGSIAYVLRACRSDMTARGGFTWPTQGPVSAPDWEVNDRCGNGLHGWMWGEGDVTACSWHVDPASRWLVCAAWAADCVALDRKVKFPRAWVVFCGDRADAAAEIVRLGAKGAVIFGTATAGDDGTATAGARGTATAGDDGTATAGDDGIIVIKRYDGKRWRLQIAYVGEGGIEPQRPYRLSDDGTFVRADGAK